jgi:hypothetical protein
MWRRFVGRQNLIAFPVAIALLQAVLVEPLAISLDHVSSFSAYARAVYHQDDLVGDAWHHVDDPRVSVWLGLAALVVGSALIQGWLRPGFLRGLLGEGATLRPPRALAVRLGLYSFATTGLIVVSTGLGERSGLVAAVVSIVVTVIFLFGDYAIVVDDVGVMQGVRRSLHVLRATLWPTLPVLFLGELLLFPLLILAFQGGFDDTQYVFAPYLLAYLLVSAVMQYTLDVVLITIYVNVPPAVRRDGPPRARQPA